MNNFDKLNNYSSFVGLRIKKDLPGKIFMPDGTFFDWTTHHP